MTSFGSRGRHHAGSRGRHHAGWTKMHMGIATLGSLPPGTGLN